jgi:hypothetical protein
MLWTTLVILLVLWGLGWMNNVAGQYIHLLLIVAGAVLIYNRIKSRAAAF